MDLPAGAKVSVRNLAKDLGISEGTAYKAIKYAEEMNLVKTKSRAGTIRLPQDIFSDVKPVTLASEIGRLGLVVLTGAEYADVPIGSILLGMLYQSGRTGCRIDSTSLNLPPNIYAHFILAKILQPFSQSFILVEPQQKTG